MWRISFNKLFFLVSFIILTHKITEPIDSMETNKTSTANNRNKIILIVLYSELCIVICREINIVISGSVTIRVTGGVYYSVDSSKMFRHNIVFNLND